MMGSWNRLVFLAKSQACPLLSEPSLNHEINSETQDRDRPFDLHPHQRVPDLGSLSVTGRQ